MYYQQPLRRFCSKRIENGRQAATRFSPFEMMHQTRGNTHEEEEEKKTIITNNSNEKKKKRVAATQAASLSGNCRKKGLV